MRMSNNVTSRLFLQRWVAHITFLGAMAIAAVNFVALRQFYDQTVAHALLHPTVLWVVTLALVFILTGLIDRNSVRVLQVLAYAAGGIITALSTPQGDLTSAVFLVFSMLLLNEYVSARTTVIVAGLVTVAYIAFLAIGLGNRTASVTLTLVNTMILVSVVIALFALISYRQQTIRREYENRLEMLVAARTAELEEAVVQRDTMLQEIHHRVGNSLQLLASFVSLQQEDAGPREQQILKETELRVHAIADVHATLYSQHQLSHLPLADYSQELISDMQIAYRSEADVIAEVCTDKEAHIDFVISFGIILNELITNAAKHGATDDQPARVEVELSDRDSDLSLIVRDHGPGFPDASPKGIGTEVIDQLVSQNHGTIHRTSDGGAVVRIVFPDRAVMRQAPIRVRQEQTA